MFIQPPTFNRCRGRRAWGGSTVARIWKRERNRCSGSWQGIVKTQVSSSSKRMRLDCKAAFSYMHTQGSKARHDTASVTRLLNPRLSAVWGTFLRPYPHLLGRQDVTSSSCPDCMRRYYCHWWWSTCWNHTLRCWSKIQTSANSGVSAFYSCVFHLYLLEITQENNGSFFFHNLQE